MADIYMITQEMEQIFDQYDDDEKFLWYCLDKKAYIGRIASVDSNVKIDYMRSREDIVKTLYSRDISDIPNIIIYACSNPSVPIFRGDLKVS